MNYSIDYKSFLKKHNMKWTTIPKSWSEGAFIGNGNLGAMMYVKDKKYFCFELGRADVVADYKITGIDFLRPRLEIGDLSLDINDELSTSNVDIELDLYNAEIAGKMLTPKGEVRLRALAPSQKDIIIIEIEALDKEDDISVDFHPIHGVSPRLHFYKEEGKEYPVPELPFSENVDGIKMSIQPFYHEGAYVTAWQEQYISKKHKIIYLTIQQSKKIEEAILKAKNYLQSAIVKGASSFIKHHRRWWHDFYSKSFISIPDTKLEGFYWNQMYKIGSATRSTSRILDLLGPWMTRTPWPGVWTNLNIQLAYSPMYTSNHLDSSESLCNALDDYMDNLILNAPEEYREDSAALGRHVAYDMREDVTIQKEYGNLTWVCHNYWRHCTYAGDTQRLTRKLYPLLKRAVQLYVHLLEKGADGYYHLPPMKSPEYKHQKGQLTRDCNYDLALLRWGCETLLNISREHQIKDEMRGQWQDILTRLVPEPADENGLMIGADRSFEHGHRHYSHLLSIYPLKMKDPINHRRVIERSLNHWLSREDNMKGYTFTGASSISSYLGKGDDAYRYLQVTLNHFIDPNTMYRESGPVIETPLAAAESVHDMLIQSHKGVITIFPALPAQWKNVAFHKLRTEGAFLVSSQLVDGEVSFVRVKAKTSGSCLLRIPLQKNPLRCEKLRDKAVHRIDACTYNIKLHKDEEIILYQGKVEEKNIAPVNSYTIYHNYFGSHKPWRNYDIPIRRDVN